MILGPNGSGKTTVLQLAAALLSPSRGDVWILGEQIGRTDMRNLRRRIGFASSAVLNSLRPTLTAHETGLTALHGALEPWWHEYTTSDHRRGPYSAR